MNNLDQIPILKKGGIHIKKKNRGKFTEYCGGKVTEKCIAKGKKSKDPKIRKRATFAANARKWKHENGGIIKAQDSAVLTPRPLSPLDIAVKTAKAQYNYKYQDIPEDQLPQLLAQVKAGNMKEVIDQYGKANFIRTEQPIVDETLSIMEWTPGVGDVAEIGYIGNDVKNGNYGTAALAATMIALPGNVGKALRKTEIPNTVSSANQKFLNAIKRNDIEQTLVEIKNKNIDIAKIKQMLKNTGVEEELLTDDNIQRLVAARQLDYINQNSVNKMALRYDNKRYNDLEYDLYRKGNTDAVGYIRAFDTQKDFVNDVGDTFPQFVDVDYVRNTSNVKGVSEQGYNAIIGDLGHVDSGRMVLSPKHTAAVHAKYPDKTLIGMFGIQKGFDEDFPVYRLNNATYPVPVKYLDTFGLEGLSPEGTFIVDFDKGPTFKFGGKMK